MARPKDIAASIKTQTLIIPQSVDATPVNGTGIDRAGISDTGLALSGEMFLSMGAETGSPTSWTATLKLQESSDDGASDAYADLLDADGNVVQVEVTAVNSEARAAVNLLSAEKYIRGVLTIVFVGGTSPEVLSAGAIALGGFDKVPQS